LKASPPRILVVGAGFLGSEIAVRAMAGGWSAVPVVRSESRAESLQELFPETLAVDAVASTFWENLGGVWSGMVWSMAPSRKSAEGEFVKMHSEGVHHATTWSKRFGVPMVYLSSTSVYAESEGAWVDEKSPLANDERADVMVQAEKKVIAAGGSVLRCAGLYGHDRKLRNTGEGPERWLNVVHVEDAARAAAIALRVRGEVFNVAEDEPLRRGVAGGVWSEGSVRTRRSKRVSNAKLKEEGWAPVHSAKL
jgi:nucleoside-diphosphate-sugar epimerase